MLSHIAARMTHLASILVICLTFGFIAAAHAHEGHDHGSAQSAAPVAAAPRVTATSERYELVGIARGHDLSIYVDRFGTNAPVTDVNVAVTIGAATQPKEAVLGEDGVYRIESEALDGGGPLELVFSITGGEGDDLLIGLLDRPEAIAFAQPEPGAGADLLDEIHSAFAGRAPLALVLALVALGLLVAPFLRRRKPTALLVLITAGALAGVVGSAKSHGDGGHSHGGVAHDHHGDEAHTSEHHNHPVVPVYDAPTRNPDGSAFVPKPTQRLLELRTRVMQEENAQPAVSLIGRVIADPNGTGLVQSITGGRIIAPEGGLPRIGQHVKQGDILATVERPIPPEERVLISEKVGEIDQLIAVAERKLERTRQLLERRVAPEAQVRDAETELEGLRERKRIVMETRAEPEILRAPVDGVVSSAKVVPGQVVAPQDVLFEIVDPSRFWVEALVYGDTDPASLAGASASVGDGKPLQLDYRGFSRSLREQATVVQFAIVNPPKTLAIGQPLRVVAKAGEARPVMVLPRASVVRGANGQQIVWRHDAPERFTPVPVRTEPLDASHLAIIAGIDAGVRIVTQAASLVNQIR